MKYMKLIPNEEKVPLCLHLS